MRVAIALAVVLAPHLAAAAPSADDLVKKVQAHYAKVAHLRGEFRQEVSDATFGTNQKSHGSIELARGNKLRLDYAHASGGGVKRSLRSDGTHLWDVEHDNKEIVTKTLGTNPTPAAVAVLTGADLSKDFTVSLTTKSGLGDDKSTVLELDPKQPSAAKHVFVVVDPATGEVRETAVVDSSGNVNHFLFDKLDAGAAVKDSDFIVDAESKDFKLYKVTADRAAARTDR